MLYMPVQGDCSVSAFHPQNTIQHQFAVGILYVLF